MSCTVHALLFDEVSTIVTTSFLGMILMIEIKIIVSHLGNTNHVVNIFVPHSYIRTHIKGMHV